MADKAIQSDGTTKRYLPKKVWAKLSKKKEKILIVKNEKVLKGKQFVANTEKAKKAKLLDVKPKTVNNGETTACLQEIINAYIERDGSQYVDTGIVAGHVAQMKLFGIRQGVEFFPSQDNFGNQRKDFIDKVVNITN